MKEKIVVFLNVLLLGFIGIGLMSCGRDDDRYEVIFTVENQYSEELKEVNIYVFASERDISFATLTTPLPTLRSQLIRSSEQNRKIENVAVNNVSAPVSFTILYYDVFDSDNSKAYFILIETITGKVISAIHYSFGASGESDWLNKKDLYDIKLKITVDKDGQIIDGF